VADELPHPILLGTDTMLPNKIDLLFSREMLAINGVNCALLHVRHDFFVQEGASITACSIPAKHTAVLWISVPKESTERTWLVEGLDKKLMIACTLT
jgi:hypothetical protein